MWIQAAAAAQTAARSIADMQNPAEDSEESSKEEEGDTEQESQDEDDKQRKAALEKLEKASEDSFLGQASHKSNHKGLIFIIFVSFVIYNCFVFPPITSLLILLCNVRISKGSSVEFIMLLFIYCLCYTE